jgi:hypothetical protein
MISNRTLTAALALAIAATAAASDYYKVNVSRKDKDLYLDHNSGVYIVTEYCSLYAG